MDLSNCAVKDLVLNESFQKWILEPDAEVKAFWETWLNNNPDKIELSTEARSIIQSMRLADENKYKCECDQVWNKIATSIDTLDNDTPMKNIKEIENTR